VPDNPRGCRAVLGLHRLHQRRRWGPGTPGRRLFAVVQPVLRGMQSAWCEAAWRAVRGSGGARV